MENSNNKDILNTSTTHLYSADLKKQTYYHKDAIKILDEEFIEFAPKKSNRQRFFEMYNNKFYNIPHQLHNYFKKQSEKLSGPYTSPLQPEVNILKEELNLIKKQINNIELKHPIFKNGSVLIEEQYWHETNGRISSPKWYMQSGKKRRIPWDYNAYQKIKKRLGLFPTKGEEILDQTYCIKVSKGTLEGIPLGPNLPSIDRLFIPIYEINTYNGQGV
ncbi:hypothetical protein OAU28_01300 [Flavobacteriales bacterium]|nr:hypothetical protein [Flavobacteriales bacterium]